MELIGLVLGGILCLYLVWKLTKAILTAVLVTITLGVLFYVGAPYVLTDAQLEKFKSATKEGGTLIDEQLERAKNLTEDGVVKPIQDSLKVPIKTPKKD